MLITKSDTKQIQLIVGAGGVVRGDLVVIASDLVVKAAAAPVDATILGIATETADAAELIIVELIENNTVMSDYAGTTKPTLADTDLGTAFDLTDSTKVNLDDTIGGACICVGYDNNIKQIMFVIPQAKRYL